MSIKNIKYIRDNARQNRFCYQNFLRFQAYNDMLQGRITRVDLNNIKDFDAFCEEYYQDGSSVVWCEPLDDEWFEIKLTNELNKETFERYVLFSAFSSDNDDIIEVLFNEIKEGRVLNVKKESV